MATEDLKSEENTQSPKQNNEKQSPGASSANSGKKEHKTSEEKGERCSWKPGCCKTKTDQWCGYMTSHKKQSITYAFLVIGLLLLFFSNLWLGGLILGGVIGYYFSSEIVFYIRNIRNIFSGQEQIRFVILTALLLGVVITIPGIFVGAIVIAALKQVFCNSCDGSKS